MTIDEQRMREQFEKWIDEKQYGLGWQDGRGTWEEFLSAAWAGYQAGSRSRDAEVQALREALTEVTEDLASELIAKYGPIQAHPDTVRRFARDMDTVYRARKLLAGGEEGEAE